MKARFQDYLREAFNARPLGMFVPPNWIGLAAFGALGFLNHGFWLLGAGLELGYLQALIGSRRFRDVISAKMNATGQQASQEKYRDRVARLQPADAKRLQDLQNRSRVILQHLQSGENPTDTEGLAANLGRLTWIYLGLLQTRQTLNQVVGEAGESTQEKIQRIEKRLPGEKNETLRRSLEGQLDILHQRFTTQQQGSEKIAWIDAELTRIEEQVELIREQALLDSDPSAVSRRIDEVNSTLGETTQFMREQQQAFGELQDILEEPPPIPLQN